MPEVPAPEVLTPEVPMPDVLVPDVAHWISAVKQSHLRFVSLTSGLTQDQATSRSMASEWSIADVASHLGSQGEIFGLMLQAGLNQTPPPSGDAFQAIWARWNALAPLAQISESASSNAALIQTVELMTNDQRESFRLDMFGSEADLSGFLTLRLGEHALHTWDVAAALDPQALLSQDAVDLLIDVVGQTAARAGQPVTDAGPISVRTDAPIREFTLTLSPAVSLTPTVSDRQAELAATSEAFIRLVYGRVSAAEMAGFGSAGVTERVAAAFPGF